MPKIPQEVLEVLKNTPMIERHEDNAPGCFICPLCDEFVNMKWKLGVTINSGADIQHPETCPYRWATNLSEPVEFVEDNPSTFHEEVPNLGQGPSAKESIHQIVDRLLEIVDVDSESDLFKRLKQVQKQVQKHVEFLELPEDRPMWLRQIVHHINHCLDSLSEEKISYVRTYINEVIESETLIDHDNEFTKSFREFISATANLLRSIQDHPTPSKIANIIDQLQTLTLTQ